MQKIKQIVFRFLIISIFVFTINYTTQIDSLNELRIRYAQIQQAWRQKKMDTVRTLMSTLKNYPLYPYLKYRQISEDLKNQSIITINNFIQKNSSLPLTKTLKLHFINELARRKDWRGLLTFSPEKPTFSDTETECNYYYAKWIAGKQKEAFSGAKKLWLTSKNHPKACNPLFRAWHSFGKQNLSIYLERIYLAMNAGNTKLVITLANQIPKNYQAISSAIIQLANNPNTILTFARTAGVNDFTQKMVIAAFSKIAKNHNIENARLMIPKLIQAQKLDDIQTQKLCNILAWQLMNDKISKKQIQWRDNAIIHSNSTALLERRIRIALNNGDHRNLNSWLEQLSTDAKKKMNGATGKLCY